MLLLNNSHLRKYSRKGVKSIENIFSFLRNTVKFQSNTTVLYFMLFNVLLSVDMNAFLS
jgi:hypothetical protein